MLPLDGIRILALSQFGAGPYGTLHLADLGAEVIKIEDPTTGGDVSRSVQPRAINGDSLYYQCFNRNKYSVALDLRQPEGMAVLHDLVRVSDGLFANLRGGQMEKLKLRYADLAHLNPRIVCCALTGYGSSGPRHTEPAYDYVVQGYSGLMSLTGEPDGPPSRAGVSVVDFVTGVTAMLGLVTGILAAQRTGQGSDVDVNLLDSAVSMLNYLAVWTLNTDFHPTRTPWSSHAALVPSQIFPTQDGYLVVMCAKEKFWQILAEEMDLAELIVDPRFKTFADRNRHRETLVAILIDRFKTRTTAQWLTQLRGKIPCGPVNSVEEALTDEQVIANGMILDVEHPTLGLVRQTATPIHFAGVETPRRPGSSLGVDTERILRDYLGYSNDRINGLRTRNVIG